MSSLARVERLKSALSVARSHARESARIGTSALVTVSGGLAAGWINAKYPHFANTTVQTSTALGVVAIACALSGLCDEYSDEVAALGSGMLAANAADESEKYFNS
jgi:hypothetical protein